MVHAAVLFAGLLGLFLALSSPFSGPETVVIAGACAALTAVLWGARLGGADSESAPYFRILRLLPLMFGRFGASLKGAVRVARMALAADVTLKPALVRLKTRAVSDGARAAFAHFISTIPGALVIDVDGDGALIHVLQEDDVDARDLGALEARIMRSVDGARG